MIIDTNTLNRILDNLLDAVDNDSCTYEMMISALENAKAAVEAERHNAVKQRGDKIAEIASRIFYCTMTKADMDFIKEAYAASTEISDKPPKNSKPADKKEFNDLEEAAMHLVDDMLKGKKPKDPDMKAIQDFLIKCGLREE